MVWRYNTSGKHFRWPPQPDQEFRTCDGQALPGANVKGDALPSPGIDFEPQSVKVSTSESGAIFLMICSRETVPNNAVLIERAVALSTLTFSSRMDSLSALTGGSIARLVRT